MATAATPKFFSQPLRYLKWAQSEKPAIFYSFVIGSIGPASFFIVPPVRQLIGDGPRERIPLTYPVPTGKRKIPSGYDD